MLQQVDRHLRRPQVLRGPARGPVRHAPRWGPFQVVFDVTSDRGDTWHLAASRADVRITSFTPSRKALRAIGPAKVRANPQATWVIGVIDPYSHHPGTFSGLPRDFLARGVVTYTAARQRRSRRRHGARRGRRSGCSFAGASRVVIGFALSCERSRVGRLLISVDADRP